MLELSGQRAPVDGTVAGELWLVAGSATLRRSEWFSFSRGRHDQVRAVTLSHAAYAFSPRGASALVRSADAVARSSVRTRALPSSTVRFAACSAAVATSAWLRPFAAEIIRVQLRLLVGNEARRF